MLIDGLHLILDLRRSRRSWLVDSMAGDEATTPVACRKAQMDVAEVAADLGFRLRT